MNNLRTLRLINDEIIESFTCENLDKYIASEQLVDFVNQKINKINTLFRGNEDVERSIWEIRKEIGFIESQYDLIDVNEDKSYEEMLELELELEEAQELSKAMEDSYDC